MTFFVTYILPLLIKIAAGYAAGGMSKDVFGFSKVKLANSRAKKAKQAQIMEMIENGQIKLPDTSEDANSLPEGKSHVS